MLDIAVKAKRVELNGDDGRQGHAISFPEPEPWPEPVNGAALVDAISTEIRKYVVMAEHSADTCALWVVHTYLLNVFHITPRLGIRSPMKRCGKTTLLDVLERLVWRPLLSGSITAAAMFRMIEAYCPSLLIDEADKFVRENPELRQLLNLGHRHNGKVTRAVGEDFEPRQFAAYAAVAIAAIGGFPDELTDRSVVIDLKRRLASEKVGSLRFDRLGHLNVLARKIARWAKDHAQALTAVDPAMPAGIHSREADNWMPLLAIADEAGGDWPDRARKAAEAAHAAAGDDAESRLELLLGDIRGIVTAKATDRLSSADLVAALVAIEGRPWAEFGKTGKPLTQGRLAQLLRPLKIAPTQIRFSTIDTRKGYQLWQFKEAFERYLGEEGGPNRNIETSAMKRALSTLPRPKHPNPMFRLRNARNPITTRHVSMFRFGKGGLEKIHPRNRPRPPERIMGHRRTRPPNPACRRSRSTGSPAGTSGRPPTSWTSGRPK